MAYTEIFTNLGLAKNEAKIYEALLHAGETTVADITRKTKIHRRNVYDSLNRLIEKGLTFEIIEKKENHYKAVHPNKLSEILEEKQNKLLNVMPALEELYKSTPRKEEVFIYRGIEGWKNNMRDILRIGKDCYVVGGKGAWRDPRLSGFFEQVDKEAKKLGIKFPILYDHEVKKEKRDIMTYLGSTYRFLPPKYSTTAVVEIFGDRVAVIPGGRKKIDEGSAITVVVNQGFADAFRTWFELMWSVSKK